jgi:hypothetical protein
MAVLRCTQLLLSKNINRNRIHICSDSRAAIAALAHNRIGFGMGEFAGARKLSRFNKVTLVQMPGHHGIPGNEKLAKKGNNGVPYDQIIVIPFVVGKEVTRSHLRREHLNRLKTCKVCSTSETLMREPVSSRTKGPQAMSRQKLKVAVGLLTGHTTLTAHMFNSDSHRCRIADYAGTKGDSVHIVCHCPVLACNRYRKLAVCP